MDSTVETSKIEKTTDYDQFTFMETNRDTNRKHVSELKKTMEKDGNLTKVQPIVVNEHGQVIDGQHSLVACKELEIPAYYRVVKGLTAHEARQMNLHRKNWSADDYAKSYAAGGDSNYKRFIELQEEYGYSGSVILTYVNKGHVKGASTTFRNGEFVLPEEEVAEIKQLLDLYSTVRELLGGTSKSMAEALLYCFMRPGYEHKRMLRKLNLYKHMLKNFNSTADNLRQLEDIYNTGQSEDTRLRLY